MAEGLEDPAVLIERARALSAAGRDEDALITLEAVIARLLDAPEADDVESARLLAFAQLNRAGLLVAADRLEEAAAAAASLRAVFDAQGDDAPLAGFGTMLLDVCFWLLSAGRDRDTLTIAQRLVDRLADGAAGQRAVAAGARFFAAHAAGRLGDDDSTRHQLAALSDMGEPALAALDRIARQFGATEANPTWHAEIAATTATVLWRLGRPDEARALARHAAERFHALGLTELEGPLRALAQEIALS